jgi:ATP-binding cassette, subfamily B, bacterial
MSIMRFLQSIIKYIAPYKWMGLFLVGGRIFEAIFESAIAMSFKFIIDEAIVPQNYELLIFILLLMGGGAILLTIISLLIDYLDARFSILIINELRQSLFTHIQGLSMDFFDRRSSGNIVNCFLADADKVENGIVYGMTVIFFNSSNILFSSIYFI